VEAEVWKCPHNMLQLSCFLCYFFGDLKFVNNCKINTAGKITLHVSFHVVNNTLLPVVRWIIFPVSAVYWSGSLYYKNRFSL